jgi:hypothetical protein
MKFGRAEEEFLEADGKFVRADRKFVRKDAAEEPRKGGFYTVLGELCGFSGIWMSDLPQFMVRKQVPGYPPAFGLPSGGFSGTK